MAYLIAVMLIVLDQISKFFAILNLKNHDSIQIIPNIFQLTYVENRGAAFGIMQNSQIFFLIATSIFLIAVVYYYEKKIKKEKNILYNFTYALLIAGAIGNFLDRGLKGYVVDFFDFYIISFPVFNIADICVCVGCFMLAIVVFFDKKK